MRSLLTLGLISFAFTFCGLSEKLQGLTDSGNTNTTPASNTSSANSSKPGDVAEPRSVEGASEVKWDNQGISWMLPKGWTKMDVRKESFNYQTPDNAFLLVNIAVLPDSFPMETSNDAYLEQAMQQVKNGKYERARSLAIDGIEGVEFVEAPPEKNDDPRRHQWIGYRSYLGQKQQVNVILSTKGSNFAKHADEFPSILYSMKFVK